MTNLKAAILGGVVALLGVIAGEGIARAECDGGSRQAALADMYEGEARGWHCEVIELENGTFEAQCDEEAFADASDACTLFVETSELYETDAFTGEVMTEQYEACMTIAIHTPGAVR